MSVRIPNDAKFGFLVALGVLAALATWSLVSAKLLPAVSA